MNIRKVIKYMLMIMLLAGLCGCSIKEKQLQVKVLILPHFEIGEMYGDAAGEAQHYYERYLMDSTAYEIDGTDHHLYYKDGIALIVGGIGKVNTAVTMTSLLTDPRFDFSQALILSTGCAGGSYGRAIMGDVVYISAIADFDLGHRVDHRELENENGYTWYEDKTFSSFAHFDLENPLNDQAYELVKDLKMSTAEISHIEMAKAFDKEQWADREPKVIRGASVSGDTYWKGFYTHENALNIIKTYDIQYIFSCTEMEESSLAFTLQKFGLLDRLISIRGIVNMDVFMNGVTPEQIWHDELDLVQEDSAETLGLFDKVLADTAIVGQTIIDAVMDGNIIVQADQ